MMQTFLSLSVTCPDCGHALSGVGTPSEPILLICYCALTKARIAYVSASIGSPVA